MGIRIEDVVVGLDEVEETLRGKAAERLGVKEEEVAAVRIVRRSVDARKKPKVVWRYVVEVALKDKNAEAVVVGRLAEAGVKAAEEEKDEPLRHGERGLGGRVVIVGTGPAGLFAGLVLAEEGYRPMLLERGKAVKERAGDYGRFLQTREANGESNLLFGEGGAGTWSDGKLRTRTRSRWAGYVLRKLVEAGAAGDIEYDAKPHVGTDVLHRVIPGIRKRIEKLGGEARFECRVDGLARAGELVRLETTKGSVEAGAVVLAVGSSARDTFEALERSGMKMEGKAFQVGMRIEHRQEIIDRAQYGSAALNEKLPSADYELVYKPERQGEHEVHTFCMCPGGEVVATVSEPGRLCVNGMSQRARAGEWANSALVWTVRRGDWQAGVAYQREVEERAFRLGGGDYGAPGQRVKEFVAGKRSEGKMETSYRLGVRGTDLRKMWGTQDVRSLASAIRAFGRRVKGFEGEGVLIGVEARASSPVRMARDDQTREAAGFRGVYPVGEGAGYAGGIMSAAVDGIESAVNIVIRYKL